VTQRRAAVVVLSWNRWELTRRCLETLRAHTDLANAEVIVVDNGSTDETAAGLAGIPWVRVVTNATNLGYVHRNNAGITAAPPKRWPRSGLGATRRGASRRGWTRSILDFLASGRSRQIDASTGQPTATLPRVARGLGHAAFGPGVMVLQTGSLFGSSAMIFLEVVF